MPEPSGLNVQDPRLIDPSLRTLGGHSIYRKGAELLRSKQTVETLREGRERPIQSGAQGVRVLCLCGAVAKWSVQGDEHGLVCDACLEGARWCLRALDGEDMTEPEPEPAKAGRYVVTAMVFPEVVSPPGEPRQVRRHRRGAVVNLDAEQAGRLVRTGNVRPFDGPEAA